VKLLQNELKNISKEKKQLLEEAAASEAERCAKTEAKVRFARFHTNVSIIN
jgi:hypothetical protein